jgi:hypothetical protein
MAADATTAVLWNHGATDPHIQVPNGFFDSKIDY